MSDNISDFESPLMQTPQNFTKQVRGVADALFVKDMAVVGGAVRDCVLGQISGQNTKPKDLDVILTAPLAAIEKNPNILGARKNSLGGMKVCLKDFGIVDIFQQYTHFPENIIADYFDFNCNSLFYRMRDNKIVASVFFHEFLESRTIRQQRIWFTQNGITGQYGVPQTVARALKFQINFMQDYDIKTKLGYDILHMAYSMKEKEELEMQDYLLSHVEDVNLQKLIWEKYQNIRK